jgi:hypothetical protein
MRGCISFANVAVYMAMWLVIVLQQLRSRRMDIKTLGKIVETVEITVHR